MAFDLETIIHNNTPKCWIKMQKAFDMVNHRFIISELESSGFGMLLVAWFKSYLDNIYQWVKLLGIKSEVFFYSLSFPLESLYDMYLLVCLNCLLTVYNIV